MSYSHLGKLALPELQVHLRKELAALRTVEKLASVEDSRLEAWLTDTLATDSDESRFLGQLSRDKNITQSTECLRELLAVFRKLGLAGLHPTLESYVLIHDIVKPLLPWLHDKLISDIMSTFDDKYRLWDSLGVTDQNVKSFYNLILRHHHIFGVMIIGELSYVAFSELFSDRDFVTLDRKLGEIVLDFLIFHACIDSSAVENGYLFRKKVNRYFEVAEIVARAYRKSDAAAELKRISKENTQQRIEWLLSAYDHELDHRFAGFYERMLSQGEWSNLLGSESFVSGMANIRRISYGSRLFYSLAHQVDHPERGHELSIPAVGRGAFIHILEALAERAAATNRNVEYHFRTIPREPHRLVEKYELTRDSRRFEDSLKKLKPRFMSSDVEVLEVDFNELR
jgi:hypothetical protein